MLAVTSACMGPRRSLVRKDPGPQFLAEEEHWEAEEVSKSSPRVFSTAMKARCGVELGEADGGKVRRRQI